MSSPLFGKPVPLSSQTSVSSGSSGRNPSLFVSTKSSKRWSESQTSKTSEISASDSQRSVEPMDVEDPANADGEKKPSKTHRHPLGEVHLRIFAWGCMVISQIGSILVFAGLVRILLQKDVLSSSEVYTPMIWGGLVISCFQYCFMPLVLVANFSNILRSRNSFFHSLLQYGGYTFGLLLVYIYIYFHYIVSFMRKVFPSITLSEACSLADSFLADLFSSLRALNMFVDLLICTLIAFFVLYTPKKLFQGKWIYLFRSFALIPVVWNILGYIFLGINEDGATIPGYLFPLIPLKPPIFLIVFIALVAYIKIGEIRFYKNGGKEEDYDKQFLAAESIHRFSIYVSIVFAVGSVIEIIFLAIVLATENKTLDRIGLGQGFLMFLTIPAVMFFDFTKPIKNPMVSLAIPIIAGAVIVVMWLESVNWVLGAVIDLVQNLLAALTDSEDA